MILIQCLEESLGTIKKRQIKYRLQHIESKCLESRF